MAKKVSQYDVGLVPVNGLRKLTPERAKRWMEKEFAAFHELSTDGLRHAKSEEDRKAFEWFAYGVKQMVVACTEAMAGASVVVYSDVGGPGGKDKIYRFGHMRQALRLLRLPSLARSEIEVVGWQDSEFNAFDALVRIIERYVNAAMGPELEADQESMRRRRAERGARCPNARLDVIYERREALKAERDAALDEVSEAAHAAVERVIDKATEPWERRMVYLKYEEDLIYHGLGDPDVKHPGKPPKGYEPQTGQDVAHA